MKYKIFRHAIFIVLISFLYVQSSSFAQEKEAKNTLINEHLKPLSPFIGKTWRGEFVNSTAEKPMVDVQHWELILNGQAIRIMHSMNEGAYGGETIVMWDKEKEKLGFFYFTTAGFYTQGTFSMDGGKFISHEYVTGNQNGITEVKGIGQILEDGRLHSKSQYLQNGKWVDGHEVYYVEDASAKLIFKE